MDLSGRPVNTVDSQAGSSVDSVPDRKPHSRTPCNTARIPATSKLAQLAVLRRAPSQQALPLQQPWRPAWVCGVPANRCHGPPCAPERARGRREKRAPEVATSTLFAHPQEARHPKGAGPLALWLFFLGPPGLVQSTTTSGSAGFAEALIERAASSLTSCDLKFKLRPALGVQLNARVRSYQPHFGCVRAQALGLPGEDAARARPVACPGCSDPPALRTGSRSGIAEVERRPRMFLEAPTVLDHAPLDYGRSPRFFTPTRGVRVPCGAPCLPLRSSSVGRAPGS